MQIDRSNYEVWFIDWLDGNLNSLQVEQLMLFLNQNQDLREEFNDLTPLNLVSSGISFRHKEDLKKSPSDISLSQFDYLCAAYLENDLSESQKTELQEIVNIYPDRKRTFDLIQKTIIAPARISYRHKNRLLRRTTLQNVIRISAIGLGAAAAISVILIIYSVIPGTGSLKQYGITHNFLPDSTPQSPSTVMPDRIIGDSIPVPVQKNLKDNSAGIHNEPDISTNPDMKMNIADDSLATKIDKQEIRIIKVSDCKQVDLRKGVVRNTLIAANPTINIPGVEDKRSQAGKLISKTFRKKFLKEKTPSDTPLKGFEIAEAGVAGLNKLFGWQMALDMQNDNNGQPKSVSFSSKILKVNAPVKKRETQP
jgi:hypothetical protein